MAFPVTCPACGKAFQLATEIYERKVAGKIVSIKCKQCHAGIRVDATKPGELNVIGATPPGGGDLSVGPRPPEPAKSAETANRREGPRPAAAEPARPAAVSATEAAGGDGPTGGAAAAPVRPPQPTLIGMMGPSAAGKTPEVVTKSSTPLLWAVDSGGAGDDRELSEEEIRREIQAGTIGAQTLVWREGMAEWLEIGKIPELKRFLARPQPKAPARSLERPAPRVQPAPQPTASSEEDPDAERTVIYDRSAPNAALDPFAIPPERDTTARVMLDDTARLAEEEAERPLPPPPPVAAGRPFEFGASAPAADPPQRLPPAPLGGTMPLGSAKAASFAGGKTEPLAARATPFREAPPPHVLAAPPGPVGKATLLGNAPPPPPLAARPAPVPPLAIPPATPIGTPGIVTAPEPPAAPRAPQAPALAPVPWGDSSAMPKPAMPAMPAANAPFSPDPFAVAATTDLDFPPPRSKKPLVIVAVIGVLAVSGIAVAIAMSKSPPVANIAAPPPVPKMTATTEAEQPEEPPPASGPGRTDPIAPSEPAQPPQTSSGNFSELFSKGAESAKGGASAPGNKGFDEAGARAALAGLLKAAAACKEPGGPTGQASATVTFDPNGTVSGVTVGAPFAGSSTGTCIVTAFKSARVAPFSGLPGTVSQTISLR